MQWDVSIGQATLLTLGIGLSVGLLSSLVAVCLSLATIWLRVFGWRIAVLLISSFLLVPLYVQATAWSSGFGSNGWFKLSQVDASKNPWLGILSVVWIHSCAALPYCFWIVTLGLRRVHDASVDQAMVESGPWYALRTQILPKLRLWMVGAFLWAFASVQYDMVVTNLFQTPTLCESVYQQVQFGKLRSLPILVAWVISMGCGLTLALGGLFLGVVHTNKTASMSKSISSPRLSRPHKVLASTVAWVVLLVPTLLPWLNLVSRMGFRATLVEGQSVRSWSVWDCGLAMWHVQDFGGEFGWSIQLSLWSAGLSMMLAACLLRITYVLSVRIVVFGLLGCMLATPGPLINLVVGQMLNRWLPSSLSFLSDRTLIGPILALQFRVLPVVFGLVWTIRQQYWDRYGDLLKLEKSLPVSMRYSAWVRYSAWGWCIAFLIGFSIAFGDLASYLLVQPPGVTTVAMRMFDLLHYGTKNREAGLALALALLGALSSLAVLRAVPKER